MNKRELKKTIFLTGCMGGPYHVQCKRWDVALVCQTSSAPLGHAIVRTVREFFGEKPKPVDPLAGLSNEDLTWALRSRGLAVQVFSVEDVNNCYDYDGAGGEQAWFEANSKRLENLLAESGNNALDAMAAYDNLPAVGDDFVGMGRG